MKQKANNKRLRFHLLCVHTHLSSCTSSQPSEPGLFIRACCRGAELVPKSRGATRGPGLLHPACGCRVASWALSTGPMFPRWLTGRGHANALVTRLPSGTPLGLISLDRVCDAFAPPEGSGVEAAELGGQCGI